MVVFSNICQLRVKHVFQNCEAHCIYSPIPSFLVLFSRSQFGIIVNYFHPSHLFASGDSEKRQYFVPFLELVFAIFFIPRVACLPLSDLEGTYNFTCRETSIGAWQFDLTWPLRTLPRSSPFYRLVTFNISFLS